MKGLAREPLVHFLLLGACLFALWEWRGADRAAAPRDEIVITPGQIERLAAGWQGTWQRPPTPREMDGLIEDRIREEVLAREAVALGLDRDDTIILRRLRQKMEFLSENLGAGAEPTEAELQAHLDAHPEAFRVGARVTFVQVYLNRDRRGEAVASDAERLLASLAHGGTDTDLDALGDPSLLPGRVERATPEEIEAVFGADFASQVTALAPGSWAGPLPSAYGLHLVSVAERVEGRAPSLAESRAAVRVDLLAARRREANEAHYRSLRARYRVVVEGTVR